MTVTVYAKPDPVTRELYETIAPDGLTVAEIVGGVYDHVVVLWDDLSECPRNLWHLVKPKPGSHIWAVRVPQDGQALQAVAAVAITVVAVATGQIYGAQLAGAVLGTEVAAGSTAAAIGSAAITATVAVAGNLALSAIVSPQTPQTPDSPDQFNRLASITGQSNQLNPFGPVPRLYGFHRIFPIIPVTGQPYTEIVGDKQFLRFKGVLGYGPLDVGGQTVGKVDGTTYSIDETTSLSGDPIRIGGTPITQFSDYEFWVGSAGVAPNANIYTDVVEQNNLSASLNSGIQEGDDDAKAVTDNVSVTRTSATNARELSVDLIFPQGLFAISPKADTLKAVVQFTVEYAPAGTTSWTRVTGNTAGVQAVNGKMANNADTNNEWRLVTSNNERASHRCALRWKVGTEQQYDVRITREKTFVEADEQIASDCTWTALRTAKARTAFQVANTVVIDLRIQASDQIQGRLDQLSVDATAMLPVYDGSQWTSPQKTRNPAWAYADVFAGNANAEPVALSQLDGPALKAWADDAAAKGLKYDKVIDQAGTVLQYAREIASTGRASWHIDRGVVSVVSDLEAGTPQITITPRVAWGFKETFRYPDVPHAVRVTFTDPNTWEKTNRTVFDDGYDFSNATKFETFETKGVADPDQAWKEGRFRLAEQRLRPAEMEFTQDVRYLLYRRGDTVDLQYDVIAVGSGAGRIKEITATDGSGNVTEFKTDETLIVDLNETYAVKVQYIDSSGDPAVFTSTVTLPSSETNTVHLDTASPDIEVGQHFLYGVSGKETQTVKITAIEPQGDLTATVRATPAAPEIYDADTGTIPAWDAKITEPLDPSRFKPNTPTILEIRSDETVLLRDEDGSLKTRLAVQYQQQSQSDQVSHIVMRFRRTGSDAAWSHTRTLPGGLQNIGFLATADVVKGEEYELQIAAVGGNGRQSDWTATQTHTVVGKSSAPPAPSGLTTTAIPGAAVLEWTNPGVPDFRTARVYTNSSDDFSTAARVGEPDGTNFVLRLDPSATKYVWVTAVDTSGNESGANATAGTQATAKNDNFDGGTNLRFEDGDTNWTKEKQWEIVQDGNSRSGNWLARFAGDGVAEDAALRNAETFATSEGERYVIAGFVKSVNSADGEAGIRITWRDGSGTVVANTTTTTTPTTSYEQVRLLAEAPAGAVEGRLEFVVLSVSTGTWYADDAFIAPVGKNTDFDALELINAPAESGADQTAGKSLTILVDRKLDNLADGDNYKRLQVGTLANRPTAGIEDRFYLATDGGTNGNPILYRDTGASWEKAGTASLADTLDAVADNIVETTLRKWAAETGADITGDHAGDVIFRAGSAPAHKIGRLWVDTNTGDINRSDGSTWTKIGSLNALNLDNAPAEAGADKSLNQVDVRVINPGFESGGRGWTALDTAWEFLQDQVVLDDDIADTTEWTLGSGWSYDSANDWIEHTAGYTTDLSRTTSNVLPGVDYTLYLRIEGTTQGSIDVTVGSDTRSGIGFTGDVPALAFRSGVSDPDVVITPTSDFDGRIAALWIQQNTARTNQGYARYDSANGTGGILRNDRRAPVEPSVRMFAQLQALKQNGADGSVTVRIAWLDNEDARIATETATLEADDATGGVYKTVKVVGDAPLNATRVTFEAEVAGLSTGAWVIDDTKMDYVDEPADAVGTVTVRNPSFEQGDTGWTKENDLWRIVEDPNEARSGRWVAKVDAAKATTAATSSRLRQKNAVSTARGDRMLVQAYVRDDLDSTINRPDGTIGIRVSWRSSPDPADEVSTATESVAADTGNLQQIRRLFEVPDDSSIEYAVVELIVQNITQGVWYADDVSAWFQVRDPDIDIAGTSGQAQTDNLDPNAVTNTVNTQVMNETSLSASSWTTVASVTVGVNAGFDLVGWGQFVFVQDNTAASKKPGYDIRILSDGVELQKETGIRPVPGGEFQKTAQPIVFKEGHVSDTDVTYEVQLKNGDSNVNAGAKDIVLQLAQIKR